MNRLPERPETFQQMEKQAQKNGKDGKKLKDNMAIYGALLLVVAVVFLFTQKVQVPFEEMIITEYTPKNDGSALFVVGKLEEGQRFAGADVEFNEETGIAEMTVYRYGVPTVFGTQDFVVMFETQEEKIREIWLNYKDADTQKTERKQLDYKMDG